MGQVEILEILVSEGGWLTSSAVQEKTNLSKVSVCKNLEQMAKYKIIMRRRDKNKCYGYEYKAIGGNKHGEHRKRNPGNNKL